MPSTRPTKLSDIQKLMATAIMRPLTPTDKTKRQWKPGVTTAQVAARLIKPNDRLTSLERLQIYNQQYWWRIKGCFEDDFPALKAVLGERQFENLALAYLEKNPSTSFTLRNLGSGLEKFLLKNPGLIRPHTRLCLDVVRLEWAHIEAFDGASREPVTLDDLLGLPAHEITLSLQPYITLMKADFPVEDFRIKVRRIGNEFDGSSNAMGSGGSKRRRKRISLPRPRTVHLAIHRQAGTVFYKRLEPEAFLLLQSLQQGHSLEESCARALKGISHPRAIAAASRQVQKWFQTWASLGWFCRRDTR